MYCLKKPHLPDKETRDWELKDKDKSVCQEDGC